MYSARANAFDLLQRTTELDVYFLPKSQFSQLMQQGKNGEFELRPLQLKVCEFVIRMLEKCKELLRRF